MTTTPGSSTPARRKVVILGGGVGGITAAFELSRAGWQEHFESITLYQQGWRLGGKGASGRGVDDRIEEHGLHLWLGYYENSFRMLRECYEELHRPPGEPLATIEQAFERASHFTVLERRPDGWLPWRASFPEDAGMPGDPAARLPSLWECLVRALLLALEFLRSVQSGVDGPSPPPDIAILPVETGPPDAIRLVPVSSLTGRLSAGLIRLRNVLADLGRSTAEAALLAAIELASTLDGDPASHGPEDHGILHTLVELAMDLARQRLPPVDQLPDATRRAWYLVDVLLACVRGVLRQGLLLSPSGLDAIDHLDFAEWLILSGASPDSARCALVTTTVYDLPFAYRDGEPDRPAASAAVALRGLIRLFFTYRGAIAWRMRAGMGDAVFAPLYEVLRRRGVKFQFFHRVDALHLSTDGSRIEVIDIGRQADVRDPVAGYQPLLSVRGLPCWPNQPLTDQLVDADDLQPADVESFWSDHRDAGPVTLRAGQDFDAVVLAIPVGAHPFVCQELIRHSPAWRCMTDQLATVNTQAFQLWLTATMEELGVDGPQTTTGGYLEPFDTYADMRQVIERESHQPGSVGSIAYFCNVMPTRRGPPDRLDRDLPVRAAAQVRTNAVRFLSRHTAEIWPRGIERYPTDFRWDLLVGDPAPHGAARFGSQYWVANVDPSARYVLALPGTTPFRLSPGASGYDNLYLAGDWTECGINSGCVEAATISGILAAHAIRGDAPPPTIIGWNEW